MGEVIPIGDSAALSAAICRIFASPEKYAGDGEALRVKFSPDTAAGKYEDLFHEIRSEIHPAS
jgi:glycosyltransferase involved in cell wall biosynthesis